MFEKNIPCILISVENRDIYTKQFTSFDLAQVQMVEEMTAMTDIPKSKFENWDGRLMLESGNGRYAFWSDGGYFHDGNKQLDWQIVEIE